MSAAWNDNSGSASWNSNADPATWKDNQGWRHQGGSADPASAQDAGWSQEGSAQDGGWRTKKKTQAAAEIETGWDGNDMARSLGIERTQKPLSSSMPDDPVERKWYHDELPQHVYRIMCPDFDCTKKQPHPVYAAAQTPESFEYKGIVFTSCTLGHTKGVRSPFLTCFLSLQHAQNRMNEAFRKPEYRKCPGYIVMLDCWTAAEENVLTQDRVHDLTSASKQEQFFDGTSFKDCLPALKHMIRRPQLLVQYKGDPDLLNYFITIHAQGQETGMLIDLIEPVEYSVINGIDPSAGWRFKAEISNTALADVLTSGPAGSQPIGQLANSAIWGDANTARADVSASGPAGSQPSGQDHWLFATDSPAAASPASIAFPPSVGPTGHPLGVTPAFASHLRATMAVDATEPRVEEELSGADNLMAVENAMQAADAQSPTLAPPQPTYKAPPANAPAPTPAEFGAYQLAEARHFVDAGLPARWCQAAPGPPPAKAPPSIVDARALVAQLEAAGASPEVLAILYNNAGMTPPAAAQSKASPPSLHQ